MVTAGKWGTQYTETSQKYLAVSRQKNGHKTAKISASHEKTPAKRTMAVEVDSAVKTAIDQLEQMQRQDDCSEPVATNTETKGLGEIEGVTTTEPEAVEPDRAKGEPSLVEKRYQPTRADLRKIKSKIRKEMKPLFLR